MKRPQRVWLVLATLTVTLGMAAWLITSVGDLHDRVAETSPPAGHRPGRAGLA